MRGELLAVDSVAITLRIGVVTGSQRLVWIAHDHLVATDFGIARVKTRDGKRLSDKNLNRLRPVSRFPQGINAELLRALLEDADQDELRCIPESLCPRAAADPGAAARSFIDTARRATGRFADLEYAISLGFRPIGPDLPNMGEHWINPRRAMRPGIDPANPSALTYLRINGEPRLTGVAYIAVVDGGTLPPPPFEGIEWHVHERTVTDEVVGGGHGAEIEPGRKRIAMMHAWLYADNPDGIFTPDNWALPYIRLGLPAPASPNPDAARALTLLAHGVDYYTTLASQAAGLDESEQDVVRSNLERCRESVAAVNLEDVADGSSSTHLAMLWRRAWDNIQSRLGVDHHDTISAVSGDVEAMVHGEGHR
jgi:hypothetical protein